ncbi:MAG: hypothetical protein ACK42D_03150 [Candidatus Paceibacteria bacterium]
MGKPIPDGVKISETVAMFLVQVTKGEISPERRKCVIKLASEMWIDSPVVYDIQSIHARLCLGNANAGEYRKSLMFDSNMRFRLYPKSSEVQKLMKQYFYPAYKHVLDTNNFTAHGPADVAWYLSAIGRCIRPFYNDNRLVFWLVENQVRVQFGLSVTPILRPKDVFDGFRKEMFRDTFSESYMS